MTGTLLWIHLNEVPMGVNEQFSYRLTPDGQSVNLTPSDKLLVTNPNIRENSITVNEPATKK